jgi:hypothetical protein
MAVSDKDAPMLLLSPKDQEVLGISLVAVDVYSLTLPDEFMLAEDQVIPPYVQPETEPRPRPEPLEPPKKAEVPVPVGNQSSKPRERTPEEVEERFQELLKQYGISD